MRYLLVCFFLYLSVQVNASTWRPLYPYIQKTENKVRCRAVPYGPHDGPGVIGETFVSFKGKPLYSIAKYFLNPFFTYNNGQYLVEFELYDHLPRRRKSRAFMGEPAKIEPFKYAGEAVNIYKNGKIFKVISFDQLRIDTAKLYRDEMRNRFGWGYQSEKGDTDKLGKKMAEYPVYISNDTLSIITIDNQLIKNNFWRNFMDDRCV